MAPKASGGTSNRSRRKPSPTPKKKAMFGFFSNPFNEEADDKATELTNYANVEVRPPDLVRGPCSFMNLATNKNCARCGLALPTPSRTPIVGGNWKCNPPSVTALTKLVDNINKCDTSACEVYVCPSPVHVPLVVGKFTNDAVVCPQNCSVTGCGAYTGETSVEQLQLLGVSWVLLGHSERRELYGETDALLAKKLACCLKRGQKVVYAIGEKKDERESGRTREVLVSQLTPIKHMLFPKTVVIAYEPVWAIGTGLVATPAMAQETHKEIREWIAENVSEYCAATIRIQYGGSANAKNAPDLSAQPDIDGFLVGGASLKPEFADIVSAISVAKQSETLSV